MFTKLDQAREGDEFTITTLGETLTYQVQTIRTITPDDPEGDDTDWFQIELLRDAYRVDPKKTLELIARIRLAGGLPES